MSVFALQAAKARDELLSFVGQLFFKTEYKSMYKANPWFIKYMLHLKKTVYQDGDVSNVSITCFIYNSIRREEIANVQWDYVSLPTPWNPKTWEYATL